MIVLSPTVLEYVGSWVLERFFGLRLWDYRDQAFNLRGRICLRFSLYWVALALVAKLVLEPLVLARIDSLRPYLSHFTAGMLMAYFILDLNHSIRSVFNFKAFLKDLTALAEKGGTFLPSFQGLETLENALDIDLDKTVRRLPSEIKCLFKPLASFPLLRRDFLPTLSVFPDWIRDHLERRFGGK